MLKRAIHTGGCGAGECVPLTVSLGPRDVYNKTFEANSNPTESLPRIFDREGGAEFDYVFNCGGETRFAQDEKVYELRSYGLSMAIGREAAKRKVKCFLEVSTGMVYKPDSAPSKESDKPKPWSNLAKWKLKAEEDLAKIEGLNLIVMRMAHVYGPYTSKYLSTALCMARVYQSKGKEMRFLWKEDLKTNLVHIEDSTRALWHGVEWYMKGPPGRRPAPTFNIVDHANHCKAFPHHVILSTVVLT